jgi:hypothetical protein
VTELLVELFNASGLSALTVEWTWGWPIAEIFHFFGLALLVGSIGILDLRMLGFAEGLGPAAVHRLVPLGILGFVFNFLSGITFIANDPVRFLDAPAFQLKMLFVLIGGLNALAFYVWVWKDAKAMGSGDPAPASGKVIAMVSLVCWTSVILVGRFMAFL